MSRGACFNRIGQVIRAAGNLGVGRAAGAARVEGKGDPGTRRRQRLRRREMEMQGSASQSASTRPSCGHSVMGAGA